MECLVLGPEGCGKTLLVKKLLLSEHDPAAKASLEDSTPPELPHTLPTVGVNVQQLEGGRTLREYGGAMAPLWSSALQDCGRVLYVVDASNPTQIAAATILLLDLLSSEHMQDKEVLVFLNKLDSPSHVTVGELEQAMRLGDLVAMGRVKVARGSARTGVGLQYIWEWLHQ